MARLASAIVAVVLVIAAPAAADDGLRIEGDTTYDVVPPEGRTAVSSTITVTNETTDRLVGNVRQRAFFNGLTIGVAAGARNLVATSSGASLSVLTTPVSDTIQRADIAFPSLFSGQRRTIVLRYDIVGDPPRTEGVSRANPAYVSFVALAVGDDTLATVRVNVPNGFEVETVGSRINESARAGGGTTLTASGFPTSDGWGVVVSARNDGALQSIDADAGSRDVVVRAWPNDVEWQQFVVRGVAEGIPLLEELTGRPWPITSQLQITEATSSYLRGYAGWFSPLDNTIEVGEDLDHETLLHELSHAWFNRGLFADRWINEGFAEEYASRALTRLGLPTDPVVLDTNSRFAVRLTEWANPRNATGDAAGRESYGYHTSAWVVRQLADEIGLPKMAEVIKAAADDTPAYGGSANEFGNIETNTSRLLDLLENIGGSKKAPDLFVDHVARESDRSVYETRTKARDRYARLVERGGDWQPPVIVRKEMGEWHFGAADLRMADAEAVIARREELRPLVEHIGVSLPSALETAYEGATTDLTAAAQMVERQLGAATTLAQTKDRLDRSRSVTQKVGLLFTHPEDRFEQARDALAAGDTDRAAELSLAAQRELDRAAAAGRNRLAIGGGVVVALAVLVVVARRIRRHGDHDTPASLSPTEPFTLAPLPSPPAPPVFVMPPPPPAPPEPR